MIIKELAKKIIYGHKYSSDKYIKFLKKHHFEIGEGTYFFDPKSVIMDINRGKFIKIGTNCKITSGVTILAHDYSWVNLIDYNNTICPSGGKELNIGNNVFIGINAILLGNVTIGNNVIIGAGSVVTKDIPDNCVCAGNPARVLCSLDEYSNRLTKNLKHNATKEAKNFLYYNGRFPKIEECGYFMVTFLERTEENFNKYIKKLSFKGTSIEYVVASFMNTTPIFNGYNSYIEYLKEHIGDSNE